MKQPNNEVFTDTYNFMRNALVTFLDLSGGTLEPINFNVNVLESLSTIEEDFLEPIPGCQDGQNRWYFFLDFGLGIKKRFFLKRLFGFNRGGFNDQIFEHWLVSEIVSSLRKNDIKPRRIKLRKFRSGLISYCIVLELND